ncbi:MAG: imidazolonepropionase [Kofleriaceae bacterium]
MSSLVIANARVMTCARHLGAGELGVIERGSVAIEAGRIAWVGEGVVPPAYAHLHTIDAKGALVTPGLVDCHTHAVFAGDRGAEFELRAAGRSYLEIQAAGGGIHATLLPTRAALANGSLAEVLIARANAMLAGGTTTIEVKTGYALTTEGELGLLETIAQAAARVAARLVPTLLAHLVPPERRGDRDAFVREICEEWIPRAAARDAPDAPFVSAVDVWCEEAAFTLAETRRIVAAAAAAGLAVRGHVGQLSDMGGAELFAAAGARSVDHLEYVSDAAIAALARAGTVAVMLPGACVQLRLPPPPVAKLRAAGVAMAVATDLNPGTSWSELLPLQMWLATTHFAMTVDEAWLGVTRHAATALGLADTGVLTPGARGDCVVWKCDRPVDVCYRMGPSLVAYVIANGSVHFG